MGRSLGAPARTEAVETVPLLLLLPLPLPLPGGSFSSSRALSTLLSIHSPHGFLHFPAALASLQLALCVSKAP